MNKTFNLAKTMMSTASSVFPLKSTKTALAILLPAAIQPEFNALRRVHDKAYHKWSPHINILYPFVEPFSLSAAITILRASLSNGNSKKIPIKLTKVEAFKHKRNATVFLQPDTESGEALCELRKELLKALGCHEGEGLRDGDFRPHLTVGQAGFQGDQMERLVEKVEKIGGAQWECAVLVVLQRESSGEMHVVEELSLESCDQLAVEEEGIM
jgi:2'-5' RNA ligase